MKILDLRLTAFGCFTDASLDLSSGSEGMHVVYGPNEAGKSTALRALRSFFFGIPMRSDDDFLHQYSQMQIGATVRRSDGGELRATRRKRNRNALLDDDGQEVEVALRDDFLGGLDEDLFVKQFGIDYEGLVQGGAELLKGGGAVGDSLFAAGLGGAGIQDVLNTLNQEMRELFLPTGQRPAINAAIAEHRAAKQTIQALELRSGDWKEHKDRLEQAREELDEVDARLGDLERQRSRLDRLQRAIPLIARWRATVADLDGLRDAPVLPEDFGEERRSLIQEREGTVHDIEEAQADLTVIDTEVAELSIPQGIIEAGATIRELHNQLSAHRKAAHDAISLRASHRHEVSDGTEVLKELRPEFEWEHVERLKLSEQQRVRIRDLGSERQSLYDRLSGAKEDLTELEGDLARRRSKLDGLEAQPDVQPLSLAINQAHRAGDPDADLAGAHHELERAQQDLRVKARQLPLWEGDPAELEALATPSRETVDKFRDERNALDADGVALTQREDALRRERADYSRALDELRLAGAVPTKDDLLQARERRDSGWGLVRRAWLEDHRDHDAIREYATDSPLHEAYESSVQEADDTADRLRREADRVAQQASLNASLLKAQRALDECSEARQALDQRREEWVFTWNATWEPVGVKPLTPAEMRDWLELHREIVDLGGDVRRQKQTVGNLKERVADHRTRLGEYMKALGEGEPGQDDTLSSTLDRAVALRDAIQEKIDERDQLEEDIPRIADDVDKGRHELEQAEHAVAIWQENWVDAIKMLGLRENATPSEANAVLTRLETLMGHAAEATSIERRLDGIERDTDKFRRDVTALVEQASPELMDTEPDRCMEQLYARLHAAEQDAVALRQLEERRKGALKRIGDAEQTERRVTARLQVMCEEAMCEDESGLSDAEERSNRKRSRQHSLEDTESQLLEQAGGGTLDDLHQEAEGIDPDTLSSQIAELTHETSTARERQGELREVIGREQRELEAMDGSSEAAAAAEDAAQLLARIGEGVERYVRLNVASMVLRREIDRYREENQAPILTSASTIFQRLTCGSFQSLTTDYSQGDDPVLIGVRPTGQHVTVEGMSDGSRDQLYLALRLASLERYLDANESMPFIVDDILIKFDDERGRAALEALHDLSQRTQVIFFTHHDHLTRIAQEALDGNLTLHRLKARSA
jgi:uncharacterized protein YhaN